MELKIKLFKKKEKTFKKHEIYGRPDVYWELAVFMVTLCIILAAIFGYYVFQNVNKESNTRNQDRSVKKIIDRNRLSKTLEYFDARKDRSVEILQTPPTVVDPSI